MTGALSQDARNPELLRVSDPRDVKSIMLAPEQFSTRNALNAVHPIAPAALRVLQRGGFALPPVLANQHGRRHRRIRAALGQLFTAEEVRQSQPVVTAAVREELSKVLPQLAGGAEVDLAERVTAVPPTVVMLHIMGWTCEDIPLLHIWSDDALELFWGWPDAQRQVHLAHHCVELYHWLRHNVLGSDNHYATVLRPLVAHDMALTDRELLSLAFFLAIAGHRTTAYLANTALTQCLQGVPVRGIAEHVLREESSVHTWRRQSELDTTVGGCPVAAGQELVLELTGNHPGPGAPGDHLLAFGYGLHRCLGAQLATMEVNVIAAAVTSTLPALQFVPTTAPPIDLLSFQAPRQVLVRRTQ